VERVAGFSGIRKLDESTLIPAWRRYTGSLYQSAHPALEEAISAGQHMLILSGGYGTALAREPIGYYNRQFNKSDWPIGLLEKVLLHYIQESGLENVVAIVSATTGYRALLDRVDWRESNLDAVFYLMPEATKGAMKKAPRAQGEALAALLSGKLDRSFISTDGLRMEVRRIMKR
jgi:hypothetical protein